MLFKAPDNRLKIIRISKELLINLLVNPILDGDTIRALLVQGVPQDAKVVDLSLEASYATNQVMVKVWSSEFPVVEEACTIPELEFTVEERQIPVYTRSRPELWLDLNQQNSTDEQIKKVEEAIKTLYEGSTLAWQSLPTYAPAIESLAPTPTLDMYVQISKDMEEWKQKWSESVDTTPSDMDWGKIVIEHRAKLANAASLIKQKLAEFFPYGWEENPNPWQTAQQLVDMAAIDLVYVGEAYLWKIPSRQGKICEVWRLDPGEVHTSALTKDEKVIMHHIKTEGKFVSVPKDEVERITFQDGISPDANRGYLSSLDWNIPGAHIEQDPNSPYYGHMVAPWASEAPPIHTTVEESYQGEDATLTILLDWKDLPELEKWVYEGTLYHSQFPNLRASKLKLLERMTGFTSDQARVKVWFEKARSGI